ncbi:uncharacterized protein B0H18DRAFT_1085877 [Fomitopsis serialis]|uniref:uncharacterized protein n=1 Tax=Fomitopsis serialis TaxID=139415 RepID=UPI00200750F3|nr:uncharacterized protein B0H18DRAFT_1085877 [Neoantrodia serialis]KAH9922506.1 hypothetical protein B0H18DRAFT_1085877 [Neoantrodia serialis]
MSKPDTTRATATTRPTTRRSVPARSMNPGVPRSVVGRRPSVSGLALTGNLNPVSGLPKAQRSSKTTQKLVVLPSEPQTKALPPPEEEDDGFHDYKSAGERMTKVQRGKADFKRITAYCVADEFKMKLLATYVKREHNVQPRVFDEAMYLAEEEGYRGTYFDSAPEASGVPPQDGWISSSPPITGGSVVSPPSMLSPGEPSADTNPAPPRKRQKRRKGSKAEDKAEYGANGEDYAEAIFFTYGVVVFFGLTEQQERGILEDVEGAGVMRKKFVEDDWEVEECHYAHDPNIAYPRIYNDFFTFKTHSHLLKLSVAHALAQSTLLAHYETHATRILSSPRTVSIPQQLALTGVLSLPRKEALRLTGRLFTLRRDVNLVSNVLDVPELFWSEASLKALYDAVREYMEIGGRVQVLNEKLAVAEDLLGAIHDHLNNSAMERITWIIIWWAHGEVIARLVVHATMGSSKAIAASTTCTNAAAALSTLSKEEALVILERIAGGGSM